jgi:palmitoyl transferase
MLRRIIIPTICVCLLLPTLVWCVQPETTGLPSPVVKKTGILASLRQSIADTWHSNEYDLYIPTYTWHNRLMYDSERVRQYNETPWGIGVGKSMKDKDGDSHFLFIMEFQDSHNRFEPYGGYAFQKNWYFDQARNWSAGIGYVLGITAREQYNYIPFPLPLPIGGIQYKRLAVQAAYIPGGYNDGNVLFIWTRWRFR